MNYLISYVFSLCLLFSLNVYPQASKVISGPMLSFIDSHGTQMWFLLESDAKQITVDVRDYYTDKLLESRRGLLTDDRSIFSISISVWIFSERKDD